MKQINNYILEKLKIGKNVKEDTNEFINEIVKLCDLKGDLKTNAIKVIKEWINKNEFSKLVKLTDLRELKKLGKEKLFTHVEKFKEDYSKTNDILADLIVNGKGKEYLIGPSWKDPKLYLTDDILIYHEYQGCNIDKIFIKEL